MNLLKLTGHSDRRGRYGARDSPADHRGGSYGRPDVPKDVKACQSSDMKLVSAVEVASEFSATSPAVPSTVDRTVKASGSSGSAWKPSQRVVEMTDDQITEIRQRLKVTVENGDDDVTGIRAAPIESFLDMVGTPGTL